MSGYEITVSVTALCVCCGKELPASAYLTESRASEGVFDRDNPYERKDRRVFISPCADCFSSRAATVKLIDALEAMVEAGEFSDWDNRCRAQDNARAVLASVKGGAA